MALLSSMFPARSLPPAAAPFGLGAFLGGCLALFRGTRELRRFEGELREALGVRHCFLVSSGKAAFCLGLQALKALNPGREDVLIPAFTCYSVPASIRRAGLQVRLCDLGGGTLDFDWDQLGEKLRSAGDGRPAQAAVLAVVPTHLFGIPADVERLRSLTRATGIAIVEDAAQAMGESIDGRPAGTLGDIGFFSLGRGKALSAVEGGVILTNRDDIAAVLEKSVSDLGGYGFVGTLALILKAAALMLLMHPRLFWIPRSLPFLRLGETLYETDFAVLKMSPFQAGVTRNWQSRLQRHRADRRSRVAQWLGFLERSGHAHVARVDGRDLGLIRMPIRIPDAGSREALLESSEREGMGVMPVYPTSIDEIPELRDAFNGEVCAEARRCARELVTLPTHGFVGEDDMAKLQETVGRALADAASARTG